jgi:DNA-binding GntR family transcriptional regulator
MHTPQYRQLYESLRHQITTGIYKEGDMIPSENELATLHQITRMTVRQALDDLVNEGYICKRKGKGSFVQSRKNSFGTLKFNAKESTEEAVLTNRMLKKPSIHEWEQGFFYDLSEDEKRAGCISLKRVILVNDKATVIEQLFLPNIQLPGFTMTTFINDSVFETLQQAYHLEITGCEQVLNAIKADGEVAFILGLEEDAPILEVFRRYKTNHDSYIYAKLLCNTSHFPLIG